MRDLRANSIGSEIRGKKPKPAPDLTNPAVSSKSSHVTASMSCRARLGQKAYCGSSDYCVRDMLIPKPFRK